VPLALLNRYPQRQPWSRRGRVLLVTVMPGRQRGLERGLKQTRDFEDFYAANYGKITALVAAVLGDRNEADDIAQEAFARALARWPRVSSYELPEAWVRQVAMRLAVDSGRRFRRMLRAMPLLRAATRSAEPEPGDSLAFTALGRVLSRVPLREREVIVLHYVADLSVEQIAHDRGIPAGTVKARLASGRRRLERGLFELGLFERGLAREQHDQEEVRDA
jgi:RNA polymerase sigma-70 factor (ECF subfamily)